MRCNCESGACLFCSKDESEMAKNAKTVVDNPMNLTRIYLDLCLIFYIYHQGKTAKPNLSIYRLLLENPIELIKSG